MSGLYRRSVDLYIIKEILVNFSPTSNVERNVEKEDSSSITAKIHNVERQILEGKLVLVGRLWVTFQSIEHVGRKVKWHIRLLRTMSRILGWPKVKRIVSLMLKKCSSDANLMKEVVCNVPVWVKFHDVLIIVFTKDGLSVIATKLGTPLMLDSYTSVMCTELWVTNAKNNTIFPTTSNSFDASNNLADVDDRGGSKTLSAQEAIQIEVHGRKDKHANVPSSSSCEQPPIIEKEVSLKSADMPRTNVVDVDN
ncbi:RNA-directed DNA polymerase, eukaryota, reverse transcriptase zinc-binding domain protein [Tanacetum coccineum]